MKTESQEWKHQQYLNLEKALAQKQYQAAQQLASNLIKTDKVIDDLQLLFDSISFEDDDQYQNWLYIVALLITPQLKHVKYSNLVTIIFDQMIGRSSPKYAIVIIRSILHKLLHNQFGKFIILSYLDRFVTLLFDPTINDVAQLYHQFTKIGKQNMHDAEQFQTHNGFKLVQIGFRMQIRFISRLLQHEYVINNKYKQNVIWIVSEMLKNIIHLDEISNIQIIAAQSIKRPYQKIPLLIISKFNLELTHLKPTFLFTLSILKQITSYPQSWSSAIYSNSKILKLILLTINNQLSSNLTQPQYHNHIEKQFIYQSILHITDQLNKKQDQNFVVQNFDAIQEFVQKINIYIGAINPQESLFKIINKTLIPLNFLQIGQKQKILSSLLTKHSNASFKVHLISQYRRLINLKCPRNIWIKSTTILFSQLKQLQPNSNIDYIGHIISFAFYWKGVLNKFISTPRFKQSIHLNIDQLVNSYTQKLSNLKKGLELRIDVSNQQSNELEHSQINVCIFRINELLENP